MKFKPEDFEEYVDVDGFVVFRDSDAAVKILNCKLAEMLAEAPVVYGLGVSNAPWDKNKLMGDTYKARLVCIEELPKEPCKHEPEQLLRVDVINRPGKTIFRCKHCGVELVATWEAKK